MFATSGGDLPFGSFRSAEHQEEGDDDDGEEQRGPGQRLLFRLG